MPNLILESQYGGYTLRTSRVYSCGLDKKYDRDWEPAQPYSIRGQSDWDFPFIAGLLGYVPCDCGLTDGTVDCEHKTATDMILSAATFLDARLNKTFSSKKYPHAYDTVKSYGEWGG